MEIHRGLDLAIIIVNYNTSALLRECLASLYGSQGGLSYDVWVVDNASTDDSGEAVALQFPQAHLICSEVNGGYAYANNLGLRAICQAQGQTPRYVLLLNPDTLLSPLALAKMCAFMEAHPEIGVLGPRLLQPSGKLDLASRRSFPTPVISLYRILGLSRLFPRSRRFARYNLTFLDPRQTVEVDSVVGACMMVRGEAIQRVGLLDEHFFMYGEDLDWAYRMKAAGWRVCYCADVTVLHYKGEASRSSRKARYEFYRAMYIFYQKHYRAETPFWLHGLIVGGIALRGGLAMLQEMLRSHQGPSLSSGAQP
jgi:N-acetylglucosaminyl-diphospho-decaprenol L-rhamnosyltransferase